MGRSREVRFDSTGGELRQIWSRRVQDGLQGPLESIQKSTLWLVLGGECDLCSETRGGQYFAAEGREIEGPP